MRGASVWAAPWWRSKVREFLRCPSSFDFLRSLAQLAARNCYASHEEPSGLQWTCSW